MGGSDIKVHLTLDAGPGIDAERLARLAQQVRAGLREIDAVESVELVRTGPAPEGSKAGDVVEWTQILVSLVGAGGGLAAMIGMLQAWATRGDRRKVTVKLGEDVFEITGMPQEGDQRRIREFIQSHAKGS